MTHIIEADDQGSITLTPGLLGGARPHARYIVEATGTEVVIRPTPDVTGAQQLSRAQWLEDCRVLAREIADASTTDRSAVDILSEMRR